MRDPDCELVAVRFDREGKEPYSVYVATLKTYPGGHRGLTEYAVDHSQRDGWAFHNTGGGPLSAEHPIPMEGAYWILSDTIPVKHLQSPEDGCWLIDGERVPYAPQRLPELPEPWEPGRDECGDWAIFAEMSESETEYCGICADNFHSDEGYRLCDHVYWCDTCGWWTGPGSDETCDHVAYCAVCRERCEAPGATGRNADTHCGCRSLRFIRRAGKAGRWVQMRSARYEFTWDLDTRLGSFKDAKKRGQPYVSMPFSGRQGRGLAQRKAVAA